MTREELREGEKMTDLSYRMNEILKDTKKREDCLAISEVRMMIVLRDFLSGLIEKLKKGNSAAEKKDDGRLTHTELCRLTAERFVKTIAIYESTMLDYEKPDVLNFDSSGFTELYEIKMSRADFLKDRKKFCRKEPAYGDRRFFVCAGDFIKAEEVPAPWGLYHYKKGRFYRIKDCPLNPNMQGKISDSQKESMLLVNFIATRKENVVRAKRLAENAAEFEARKILKGKK